MRIVMWMSEVLPNHVCCRQVIHDSGLKTKRSTVVSYLAGLIRAMNFYRNPANRTRVLDIAAKWIPTASLSLLAQELFPNPKTSEAPRTTLSVDLNRAGVVEYINAMRGMQAIDAERERLVLRKIDASLLTDAYQALGLSASDARTCVDQGFDKCRAAGAVIK